MTHFEQSMNLVDVWGSFRLVLSHENIEFRMSFLLLNICSMHFYHSSETSRISQVFKCELYS